MSEQHARLAPEPAPADVGIVAALQIETGDIVEALTAVRRYQSARMPVIEGERAGKIVAVVAGGPGRHNAQAATELLLSGHRPRLIIAAGFAGALDPDLKRNDLVLPEQIIDREGLCLEAEKPASLAAALVHSTGRLLTVDHVVVSASQKAELRAAYQADAVDMETSAVAAACRDKRVRFLAVRVISDDAHTDLPREVAGMMTKGASYGVGRALRAVWQRPSSIKDFWSLYEHAIEAADRLAKGLFRLLETLDV
jgi:adenosylhomocysteine nucleosidase